jgi:hypothetical protein
LAPVDNKLLLLDAIADPIESHVNGLGATLFNSVVDNASGTGVVGLDGSGRLGVPPGFQGGAQPGCVFGVIEQGAEFGFSGAGHYDLKNGAGNMHRAVFRWWFGSGNDVGCMVGRAGT